MQCPKPDCMYLHELGDEAASFTKEEMQVNLNFYFLSDRFCHKCFVYVLMVLLYCAVRKKVNVDVLCSPSGGKTSRV